MLILTKKVVDGHFPLNTFEYIRSRMAKNLKIELVVVDRPTRRLDDESASSKEGK